MSILIHLDQRLDLYTSEQPFVPNQYFNRVTVPHISRLPILPIHRYYIKLIRQFT